jgi:Lrp/AsnC family leucine-responsive transcriptional regulator
MDEIDIKILRILINRGRETLSEISNQVNLSIPAVSERIKKLESSEVIDRYTVILNPKKFKKELTAIMLISIERARPVKDFLNIVRNSPDVVECHYIAGDYDYLLKIVTENTATLEMLLNNIKAVRGVQKTKTVVVLSTVKDNPSISP